jgi:hypothetical protein
MHNEFSSNTVERVKGRVVSKESYVYATNQPATATERCVLNKSI